METAIALGVLGLGAYLVAKRTQPETYSDITALAFDTKPARTEDTLLAPQPTVFPARDRFIAGQDIVIPDAAQNPGQYVPKFYNFPRKEQLAIQEPELGSDHSLFPALSRVYEKDRLGVISMNTLKDYRNARGEITESFSTGQNVSERQTPTEAIMERTRVADAWNLDPHVVRVNDDQDPRFNVADPKLRGYGVAPYWTSLARPRPRDTLRKALDSETTNFRPTISNDIGYSYGSRVQYGNMGRDRDTTIERNHTTITPSYGRDEYPRIIQNPVAEYSREQDYTGSVNVTPQWDGPSGVPSLEVPRQRAKADLYDASHATRPGVSNGLGWRQFSIDSQKRRIGNPQNTRTPEVSAKQDTPYSAYTPTQFEARKAGLSLQNVTNWIPSFPKSIMNKFTKPAPTGLAPGAAISPSIADNREGDPDWD